MNILLGQVDLSQAVSATGVDINQIAELSGGNPLMVVAIGVVAVLGGKTLWDYLKNKKELEHEQKMAEIEAQKVSSSTGHEQCVAKQQALETQVTSLKGKVSELEGKVVSSEKSVSDLKEGNQKSLEEIEDTIKKVKKKVKKVEESVQEIEKKK